MVRKPPIRKIKQALWDSVNDVPSSQFPQKVLEIVSTHMNAPPDKCKYIPMKSLGRYISEKRKLRNEIGYQYEIKESRIDVVVCGKWLVFLLMDIYIDLIESCKGKDSKITIDDIDVWALKSPI